MTDNLSWAATIFAVLALAAWYLSYSAARLDRLHARVEGALTALDAQLVRRAEATLELANSGELDPASALLLATAASDSLEAADERHAGREAIESDLTQALSLALSTETLAQIHADGELAEAALERVRAAAQRVRLAHRFHDDAVTDVRRVRHKRVVRWFRLAGYAELPTAIEFDDQLPLLERAT